MIHRSTSRTYGGSHAPKKIDVAGNPGNSEPDYRSLAIPKVTTRRTSVIPAREFSEAKATGALRKSDFRAS